MPHSKIKEGVAQILVEQGYVGGVSVEDAAVGKTLVVELPHGPNRERSMRASGGSASPVCGCTRRAPECPRFSADWVSPSSTRPVC
jgi:small subunit ribosomal protein S8